MPKRRRDQDGEGAEDVDDGTGARKEQILGELQAQYASLDAAETMQRLEEAQAKWGVFDVDASFAEIMQRAFNNFEVPMTQPVSFEERHVALAEIDCRIWEHEARGMLLFQRIRDLGDELEPAAFTAVERVLEQMYYAKKVVFSAVQSKHALLEANAGSAAPAMPQDLSKRLGAWGLRFKWMGSNAENLKDMQLLLLYLVDVAHERGYRKADGLVMEPIIVDGHDTHAWRQVCELEQFVDFHTRMETQWEQWKWRTSSGSITKSVVEYLMASNDYRFPKLTKDRHVFSFRNGVYLAHEDRFVPYGSQPPLPASLAAAKYFDLRFPERHAQGPWRDIPTPYARQVGEYQGWPEEVHDWLMVMIGRMLYEVGELDGWQVLPYLHGAAGSGKSLLTLGVVKQLYDASDVGTLSNNCERKWVLSSLVDKFIFVCPEARNDMQLEQSEWQSVVSGESVSIARKFKTATSIDRWTSPGWMAGNEIVNWKDGSGSVVRRIMVFPFPRAVTRGDMLLNRKLAGEMPAILLKANRAYLEAAEAFGNQNIWDVVPDFFKEQQRELATDVNSVEAFLASTEVRYGEDLHMPLEAFKSALKAFETANNIKSQRYNSDAFRQPFERRGLRVTRGQLEYRGRRQTKDYVIGIDLSEDTTSAFLA